MGLNPSGITTIVPAAFTNDYKAFAPATLGLQPVQKMQLWQKWIHRRRDASMERK
jgi:hypothetical protein